MSEKIDYHELINGKIPPWVMRFIKLTGKSINDFDMIRGGDKVLLGVSGGKDSLALALALSLRRKWLPVDYELNALMINWIEHPIPEPARVELANYFKDLDINFTIIDEAQYSEGFKGDFNCYLCSRNRRRLLFNYANEMGYRTVAMGHHLDDLVETTMMNLFLRGKFNTMLPVQPFFDGKMFIIRPMIHVRENTTRRLSEMYNLPTVKPVCPYDQTNIRSQLKPIVSQFCHMDRYSCDHVFNAHNFTFKKPDTTDQPS